MYFLATFLPLHLFYSFLSNKFPRHVYLCQLFIVIVVFSFMPASFLDDYIRIHSRLDFCLYQSMSFSTIKGLLYSCENILTSGLVFILRLFSLSTSHNFFISYLLYFPMESFSPFLGTYT